MIEPLLTSMDDWTKVTPSNLLVQRLKERAQEVAGQVFIIETVDRRRGDEGSNNIIVRLHGTARDEPAELLDEVWTRTPQPKVSLGIRVPIQKGSRGDLNRVVDGSEVEQPRRALAR